MQKEYHCEKYAYIDDFDSFKTHRNRKSDMEKTKRFGIDTYNAERQKRQKFWRFSCRANKKKG